jgi:hypothetical protein
LNDERRAGILWIVAAIIAAGVTVAFRVVPGQSVVTLAASAIAIGIGALLIYRPSPCS